MENHLHLPAGLNDLAATELGHIYDLPALLPKEDLPGGRVYGAENHPPGGGLAATTLANQPQNFALGEREADAIHGLYQTRLAL